MSSPCSRRAPPHDAVDAPPPPAPPHEIYQARAAIEGYAIRLLTEAGEERRFNQIEAVIKFQESRELSRLADFYDANKNIHRSFVEQTQNKYLLEMFDLNWNRGFSYHLFTTMNDEALKNSLGEHSQLCQVMRSGDANKAVEAMLEHIGDGLELQLNALSERG